MCLRMDVSRTPSRKRPLLKFACVKGSLLGAPLNFPRATASLSASKSRYCSGECVVSRFSLILEVTSHHKGEWSECQHSWKTTFTCELILSKKNAINRWIFWFLCRLLLGGLLDLKHNSGFDNFYCQWIGFTKIGPFNTLNNMGAYLSSSDKSGRFCTGLDTNKKPRTRKHPQLVNYSRSFCTQARKRARTSYNWTELQHLHIPGSRLRAKSCV